MKLRDAAVYFAIAVIAGVGGWVVRDRSLPRPNLVTVHDTVVKTIERITAGRTIIVQDLTAADAERVKREAAESRIETIIASLGDTATAPEPVKALVRACSALMSSCQLEAAALRRANATSDSLLTEATQSLTIARDSLAAASRVTSKCTDPAFIRAAKGTILGAGVGNIVGFAVGALSPVSLRDGLTIGAIAGAVGGFVGATTARCE